MWSAIVIVMAILVLHLGNGSLLAQTGVEWRWLGSLHMLDAQTGWAVSTEGGGGAFSRGAVGSVVRTTDGGFHWRDVTPHVPPGQRLSTQGVGMVRALTPLSAWLVASLSPLTPDERQSSPALFQTIDGGQTWINVPISGFGLMDFINAREGWLISGNEVRHSTDGGRNWIKAGSPEFNCRTRNTTQTVTFPNATTGWITGFCEHWEPEVSEPSRTYHLVSRDGGTNWQQQKLSLPSSLTRAAGVLHFYLPLPPVFPHGDYPHHRLRFFTAKDAILPVAYGSSTDAGVLFYVTHDGGTTWTYTTPVALPDPDRCCLGLSFADASHGWVTDGQVLYVTGDGGREWMKIQPSLPERPLVELNFTSPQVGWATGELMMKPFLLRSLDGGRTWTSIPYVIVRQ